MLTVQFSDLCWEKFFQRLWTLKWPESGSRRDSLVDREKKRLPKTTAIGPWDGDVCEGNRSVQDNRENKGSMFAGKEIGY